MDHPGPEGTDFAEIEFRRKAEGYGSRMGMSQEGIQFPDDRRHALISQMLEREIDKVKVHPLYEKAGTGKDPVPGFRRKGRGKVRVETALFQKRRDGLYSADICEILCCHAIFYSGSPQN